MKRLAFFGAVLLGLTAAWWVSRESAPVTPTPGIAASAPLPIGQQAVPSSAPPVPASMAVATPAARLAAAPSTASIGAEGYGPHIDQARASQDPKAIWEAVQWLRQCASNEGRRASFEAMRNHGVSPEMMTQLMVEADAEARRCQTVTATHRALLPELASRAMRAGLPEAASAYAGAVFPGDLTATQRSEVAEAMRRDALAGDVPSLLGALTAHEAWGLSDEERLRYLVAYAALGGQPAQAMAKALIDNGQIRFRTKPTPAELEAALRLARPWLEPLLSQRHP
ncbi:MAG: hypothetical protein EKK53_05485 [Burkholderiales bacterium]|nr:MAG: hypothetical protein EKK53_05485 [Burkholderiales bacterium]